MADPIRETAERLLQRLEGPSGTPYADQFLELAKIDLRNALAAGPPAQPAHWQQLCGELLRGLDENRHPEVRYPGHLRLVMAIARAALAAEPTPTPKPQGEEVAE